MIDSTDQITPVIGERLPNEKLAITESMLQMLTNEHFAEQRRKASAGTSYKRSIEHKKLTKPSTSPGGFIRTVRSAKQGKSQEWQLLTADNVERAKSTPLASGAEPKGRSKTTEQCEMQDPVGDTVLEIDGKAFTTVTNPGHDAIMDEVLLSSRGKNFKKAWEGSKVPQESVVDEVNVVGPVMDDAAGPSVVLRASSSGNNINVSCTFDKNLLNSEKPVALKFNSDKKLENVDNIAEGAEEQGNIQRDQTKDAAGSKRQSSAAKKKVTANSKPSVVQSKLSSEKPPEVEKIKPKSGRKREYAILKKDEECQTFLSELTKDNLDYFTAEKRFGAAKQKKVIEAWVEDVNKHIKAGTLEYTGDKVLSEAEKSQAQSPISKTQPATERSQPITWQLKTKNLTLPERPSTSDPTRLVEHKNVNVQSASYGINNLTMTGLWGRLRDMASTPFRGLYTNRLEDLPAPTAPTNVTNPVRVSTAKHVYVPDSEGVGVKRRHSDKKIPPLHKSHSPNYHAPSSSSGRQPRKSAKGSIYSQDNGTRDKGKFRTWMQICYKEICMYNTGADPGLLVGGSPIPWERLQLNIIFTFS